MKDVILGFLSKTLKMGNEQLAELLYKTDDEGNLTDEFKEDALQSLLDLDAQRVQGLKPDTKTIFDNGHKKGLKEGAERLEKALRDRFGIEDASATGDDLLELVQAAQGAGDQKPVDVKTSKEYRDLERQLRAEVKRLQDEKEAEINGLKLQWQKEQTWQQAKAQIRETLTALNPVLPEDQAKADRMLALFMREFSDLEFQPDEKEGFIPVREGSRLEDSHGYGITLADLVKAKAEEVFDFREQAPAGSAGNKNKPPIRSSSERFKDEGDYLVRYHNAATQEEKEALYAAWTLQKTAGEN